MNRQTRKVVVTGMGLVTPIGFDEKTFFDNLLAGRHGIARLRGVDASLYKAQNGAEVDTPQLDAALAARGWKPLDRTVDMALLAAAAALEAAGLIVPGSQPAAPLEMGVLVGSGGGPSYSIEEAYGRIILQGVKGVRPTTIARCMANAISSQVSMRFRLTGPNYVIVSACTSSTNAIGTGFRLVRDGYADRVLCGGSDACFTPGIYSAWDKLGVMSRNTDPALASRPFDVNREGFVLGEGAGMLVLESRDAAEARGARTRAELCGYGESSDAEHISRPSEQGQARAMRMAIDDAGLSPADIGFINAHGTGTEANDECESRSLRAVLGDAVDTIPVTSNKSSFGHMMGAAGAVETIATILSLETLLAPPNLNLDNPDPSCNLCFVRGAPARIVRPVAMKNSFGFGGGNGVLVLRQAGQAGRSANPGR